MMANMRLLDIVALTGDLPEKSLLRGQVGTVVEVFPDGQYEVEGWHMRSRTDVAAMVQSPAHQGLIGGGSAHFLGPVCVDVDGDHAVAVCESILVRHNDDGGYRVWRAGANHVTLRRTAGGWRCP